MVVHGGQEKNKKSTPLIYNNKNELWEIGKSLKFEFLFKIFKLYSTLLLVIIYPILNFYEFIIYYNRFCIFLYYFSTHH